MKKTAVLMCVLCLLCTLWAPVVYGEEVVLKNFTVSTATSTDGTGFRFGSVTGNVFSVAAATGEGAEGNALSISGPNGTVAYYQGWSSETTKYFVLKTRFMTPDVTEGNTKTYNFRVKSGYSTISALSISGDKLLCNKETVPDFTVTPNQWYDAVVVLRNKPSYMMDLYLDGKKVLSSAAPDVAGITATNLQFRIDVSGGTLCVGDTKLYQPAQASATAVKSKLASATEPIEIAFSEPIDPDTLVKSNFTVKDLFGVQPDFTVTPITGEDGMTCGAKLDFSGGVGLTEDNEYTVSFSDSLVDIAGLTPAESSLKVETPAPENLFDWKGGVTLLVDGVPADSLAAGEVTVSLSADYFGSRPRPVTLMVVLWQDGRLEELEYVSCEMTQQESAKLSASLVLDSVTDTTVVKAMVWEDVLGHPWLPAAEFK